MHLPCHNPDCSAAPFHAGDHFAEPSDTTSSAPFLGKGKGGFAPGGCRRPLRAQLGRDGASAPLMLGWVWRRLPGRKIIKTDVDKASAGIFCFRAITESGDENKMNKVQSVICFSWPYHSSAPSAFVGVSSTGTGALSCRSHPLAQEMFCSGLLSQTASGVPLPRLRASPKYPHGGIGAPSSTAAQSSWQLSP